MSDDKPASFGTDAAMARLLERHGDKIKWGCYYAIRIAFDNLTVHSRQVRDAMFKDGLIGEGKEHWLGTVFKQLSEKDQVIEWTGHWYKYSDRSRRINERTVKIWTIKKGSNYQPFLEMPTL